MEPDRALRLRSFIEGWCKTQGLECVWTHHVFGRHYYSIVNQDHSKGVEIRVYGNEVTAFIADKKYPHGGKDMGSVENIIPILKGVFK